MVYTAAIVKKGFGNGLIVLCEFFVKETGIGRFGWKLLSMGYVQRFYLGVRGTLRLDG